MNHHAHSTIGESDDHHDPVKAISDDCSSHVVIRPPYTCAFCNRGFSNAQALGGHMNIHRRDRAKLKLQAMAAASAEEQEDEEKTTVDQVLDDRIITPDDEEFLFLESHQHKIGNLIPDHKKRPSSVQDHATSTCVKEEEKDEKMQLSRTRSSSVPELDLELRLGPAGLPAG